MMLTDLPFSLIASSILWLVVMLGIQGYVIWLMLVVCRSPENFKDYLPPIWGIAKMVVLYIVLSYAGMWDAIFHF